MRGTQEGAVLVRSLVLGFEVGDRDDPATNQFHVKLQSLQLPSKCPTKLLEHRKLTWVVLDFVSLKPESDQDWHWASCCRRKTLWISFFFLLPLSFCFMFFLVVLPNQNKALLLVFSLSNAA